MKITKLISILSLLFIFNSSKSLDIKNITFDRTIGFLSLVPAVYNLKEHIKFIKENLKAASNKEKCTCPIRCHSPLTCIAGVSVKELIPSLFLLINSCKLITAKINNSNKLFGISGMLYTLGILALLFEKHNLFSQKFFISNYVHKHIFRWIFSLLLTNFNSLRLLRYSIDPLDRKITIITFILQILTSINIAIDFKP